MTETEAKMFSVSGPSVSWAVESPLVPAYIEFAGEKDGDRVLDVGTGTGALASAQEGP